MHGMAPVTPAAPSSRWRWPCHTPPPLTHTQCARPRFLCYCYPIMTRGVHILFLPSLQPPTVGRTHLSSTPSG